MNLGELDPGAVYSFLMTIVFVLICWRLMPFAYNRIRRKRVLSDLPSTLEYLGDHPYVGHIVIGFVVIGFLSLWATVWKVGQVFRRFLEQGFTVSAFTLEIIDAISLLLLTYLSYSLISAVKLSEAGDKTPAIRGILASSIVGLAVALLLVIPQVTDRQIYAAWPDLSLVLILFSLSASIAILAIASLRFGTSK